MIKEISMEDKGYFAGLLDGEGCITINKSIKKNSIGYSFNVQFGLTYKKVLLEMQKIFGGNISEENVEKRLKCNSVQKSKKAGCSSPEEWKQKYYFRLIGRDALYFLKVVEPFCREKKEQAALGIKYEQGRRSRAGRYGRSSSETERCEFFYKELQRLKQEQSDEADNEIDFEDNQQSLFSVGAELCIASDCFINKGVS